MCDNAGTWDMRQLLSAGYISRDPIHAVTFVENHDTDHGAPIISNKLLAYAFILTAEGYPCVYYKDYSLDPTCYQLKAQLDNLIWIHEHLANGATNYRWLDFQFLVYERSSWPNLLVGINNDPSNSWKTVTVQTGFGSNLQLHDFSGHAGDVWTDGDGRATIGIPPNVNGLGYVCYSRIGINQGFTVNRRSTRQVFAGAEDLDTSPAQQGEDIFVGRVWCDAGFPIELSKLDAPAQLSFRLISPSDKVLPLNHDRGQVSERGWHTLRVTSTVPGKHPYSVALNYMGTQEL
jgi:alpha-amylase